MLIICAIVWIVCIIINILFEIYDQKDYKYIDLENIWQVFLLSLVMAPIVTCALIHITLKDYFKIKCNIKNPFYKE